VRYSRLHIPIRENMLKSQSAMEYLMTYGWSILIIAVVLGTLYSLNVFSSANYAPKAQPGSCKVFRTPATTSLTGLCSNLKPQYVTQFSGTAYVIVPSFSAKMVGRSMTIAGWVYPIGNPSGYSPYFGIRNDVDANFYALQLINSNNLEMRLKDSTGASFQLPALAIVPNTWNFVALTYDGSILTGYVNSNSVSAIVSGAITNTLVSFNMGLALTTMKFQGKYMADVQAYNTSLDSNQIAALYQEGIGGAPIQLQNLVGWWPLNGDPNDYSGNNNNGVPTNVIFTTQ
jgi:hypothetical protein